MQILKKLSVLIIVFSSLNVFCQADVSLKSAKAFIDQKNWNAAIPILFRIGYEQKTKYSKNSVQIARQWLGVTLYRAGYPQLASFPLVSVSTEGTPALAQRSLGLLVKISDDLKDKSLLNYSILKLDINQSSEISRELFYLKLAETYMNEGKLPEAESNYLNVLSINSKNDTALYSLGLIHLKNNKPSEAYRRFEQFYDKYQNRKITDKKRGLASISIARTLYQAKMWDDSIEFYKDIPKDHSIYRKAQFELAWAQFRAMKFRAALSSIETLQTPYYETFFDPESIILRSIILLFICQVDDIENTLSTYEKFYSPVISVLSAWLQTEHKDEDYLQLINSAYINLRLIQSGLKPTQNSKLPFFLLRSGLESNDIKPHFQLIRRLQQERKNFRKSGIKKSNPLNRFAERVYLNRIRSTQKQLAQGVRKYLNEVRGQLKDYNVQIDLIKYEFLNLKKNVLASKVNDQVDQNTALQSSVSNKKRDFFLDNGYRYWPFNGEFWADEVGNYQYIGVNKCQNDEKESKNE
jgi:hypothetical protein